MDGPDNGSVTTEQILAILGVKEVEIQMLRQRLAAVSHSLQSAEDALRTLQLSIDESSKKGK